MFCDVVAEYSGNEEEFVLEEVQFCGSKKNEDGGQVVVVNEEEEGKALGKEEKSSCSFILVVAVGRPRGREEERVREGGREDVGGVGAGGDVVGGVGGLEGGRGRGRCCGATCWGGRVELVTSIIQQIV